MVVLLQFPDGTREPARFSELVSHAREGMVPVVNMALDMIVAQLGAFENASNGTSTMHDDAAILLARKEEREATLREMQSRTDSMKQQYQEELETIEKQLQDTKRQLAGTASRNQILQQDERNRNLAHEREQSTLLEQLRVATNNCERLREQHAQRLIESDEQVRARAMVLVEGERASFLHHTQLHHQRMQAMEQAMEQDRALMHRQLENSHALQQALSPHAQALIESIEARHAHEVAGLQAHKDELRRERDHSQAQLQAAIACIPVARAADDKDMTNSKRGREGEDLCHSLLRQAFNGGCADTAHFSLRDVSNEKTAGCGDIEMMLEGACVRIESKNYKKQVDRSELDKFKDELSLRNDVAAGIFMSLGPKGVAGMVGDYDEVFVRGIGADTGAAGAGGVATKLFVVTSIWDGDDRERQVRLAQMAVSVRAHIALWMETQAAEGTDTASAQMHWRATALMGKQHELNAARARVAELSTAITTINNEGLRLKAHVKTAKMHVERLQKELDAMRIDRAWKSEELDTCTTTTTTQEDVGSKRPRLDTAVSPTSTLSNASMSVSFADVINPPCATATVSATGSGSGSGGCLGGLVVQWVNDMAASKLGVHDKMSTITKQDSLDSFMLWASQHPGPNTSVALTCTSLVLSRHLKNIPGVRTDVSGIPAAGAKSVSVNRFDWSVIRRGLQPVDETAHSVPCVPCVPSVPLSLTKPAPVSVEHADAWADAEFPLPMPAPTPMHAHVPSAEVDAAEPGHVEESKTY